MKPGWGWSILVCLLSTGWATAQATAPTLSAGRFDAAGYFAAGAEPAPATQGNEWAGGRDAAMHGNSGWLQNSPSDGGYSPSGSSWWVSADYLLWWFKEPHVPPLVTAGPPGSNGILGRPGTVVLFGDSDIDLHDHHGARLTAGMMVDEDELVGIEGNYFFVGRRGASFAAQSSGDPLLARPFFNTNLNAQDSELVASPGLLAGSVRVGLDSELQGAEANLLCVAEDNCCCQVILLAGFRYAQLDEGLGINESLFVLPTAPALGGSRIGVSDFFGTHSHFYGGQVGVRGGWWYRSVLFQVDAKVAIGLSHESINIDGSTQTVSASGVSTVQAGGLLAVPSNMGHFHRDEFAVLPEIGVKLGYRLTDAILLTAGYSFLYWSDVARPGDQVDLALNPSQLPTSSGAGTLVGAARPAATLHGTDFWAHGLNVGIELRY